MNYITVIVTHLKHTHVHTHTHIHSDNTNTNNTNTILILNAKLLYIDSCVTGSQTHDLCLATTTHRTK